MRAIQQSAWGEAETMALVEVEEPAPVFGEVLVRVMAAAVNPVDVFTRRGQAYNRVLDLPFINGWDVQTAAFLRTFPDYGVELEYLVAARLAVWRKQAKAVA
ncbi:alcohol dehydrogenase catalytic domain-containing protein [Streptosporangium sp. NPDC003464]